MGPIVIPRNACSEPNGERPKASRSAEKARAGGLTRPITTSASASATVLRPRSACSEPRDVYPSARKTVLGREFTWQAILIHEQGRSSRNGRRHPRRARRRPIQHQGRPGRGRRPRPTFWSNAAPPHSSVARRPGARRRLPLRPLARTHRLPRQVSVPKRRVLLVAPALGLALACDEAKQPSETKPTPVSAPRGSASAREPAKPPALLYLPDGGDVAIGGDRGPPPPL